MAKGKCVMKKAILIISLACIIFLMFGCGPDSTQPGTPAYIYINSFRGGEIRLHVRNLVTDPYLTSGEKRERIFVRDEQSLQELMDALRLVAAEETIFELYDDKLYIQTSENGETGSAVITSTGQVYEGIYVRESDADIHYEYKIDNMGAWLGDTDYYIILPLHLIDESPETYPEAETERMLVEDAAYHTEADIGAFVSFYETKGYSVTGDGDCLVISDTNTKTLSSEAYGNRRLVRPDEISFVITFSGDSVMYSRDIWQQP